MDSPHPIFSSYARLGLAVPPPNMACLSHLFPLRYFGPLASSPTSFSLFPPTIFLLCTGSLRASFLGFTGLLQLLPSVSHLSVFSHFCLLGVSHRSLLQIPSLIFLPQVLSLSLSLSFLYFSLPHFLSPSLSATSCSPSSGFLCFALPFQPRPDSPNRGELRDGGSGRSPPLPAVGKMAWPGRGEGGGGGDGNTRGLWGPFKGSFMDWREAETKRPRRRDTARASLGGDTQTEQAGGNQTQGGIWEEEDPNGPPRSPLHPAWLSSYLDQPWGRGASIQGSEWGADGLQKGGGGL